LQGFSNYPDGNPLPGKLQVFLENTHRNEKLIICNYRHASYFLEENNEII